jgi:nucleoid-associated protein YgaU
MKSPLRFCILPLALALAGMARADDAPAAAPAPDAASLKADNKQLTDELAAAWKENDRLKAQVAAAAAPAAPAEPDSAADLKDKLATSLRSFSVVEDENAGLKASVDKLTADNAGLKQDLDQARALVASLQVQAAATSQIEPLRNQARQAEDQAAALESENAQLRTRLALLAPGPGSTRPVPLRPGQAPAPEAAPTPTPTPTPKTYVVADGDTLTRISKKFYGTPARWEDILKANRPALKDEKSLAVGSTLTIP